MVARQLEVGFRVKVNNVGGGKDTVLDLGKSCCSLFKFEGGSSNVPLDSAQSLGPSTRNVGKRSRRDLNRGRLGPSHLIADLVGSECTKGSRKLMGERWDVVRNIGEGAGTLGVRGPGNQRKHLEYIVGFG